jgi:hypothetical protein
LVSVLVFSGVFMLCRFMCESGETPSNPPRLRSFFFACGRAAKNLLAVLEFAVSSSSYDDALSTRQEVTQLLRRRQQLNAAHHR